MSVSVLLACSSKDSPEAQLRALLAQAETAAEGKQLGEIKDLISEHYSDEDGNDKAKLTRLVQFYFLRQQSIHLLTRISALNFPVPGQAKVSLLVGLAGQPVAAAEELARLQAELFRFELEWVDEGRGAWKLIQARWRRVDMNDFL